MATPYRIIRHNASSGLNEEVDIEGTEPILSRKVSLSQPPKFSCYVDGNTIGNSASQNTYIRANGTWNVQNAVNFSYLTSPASDVNKIRYTGTESIHACIQWVYTPFASTDNQMVWVIIIKNDTADSYSPFAPPNLPPLTIPGSVVKSNGRNLTAVLSSNSGMCFTDLNTNDTVRFYMANVTSGSGVNLRDMRVRISTVYYL
jgi:hypothetical protein